MWTANAVAACFAFLTSVIAFAGEVSGPDGRSGWIELFDGESLAGWRAERKPEAWSVVDGALRAHGVTGASHLYYVGGGDEPVAFDDFELVAEVRLRASSNGGIFFHTDETIRRPGWPGPLNGYELQLNNTKKEKRKTGSLYKIVDLAASPVDETEWFTVGLTVSDERVMIAVAGETVVDYVEPADVARPPSLAGQRLRDDGGAIALQAHDPKSVVEFRSIKVRRLDPEGADG